MKPWHMAQVPPQRWAEFTALPRHDWIEMWTRSDLLMYPDGGVDAVDIWGELIGGNGTGEGFPVQLHCSQCMATKAYHATWDDDTGQDAEMFALPGLDERMADFVTAHTGCPLQMKMAV